MRLSLFLIALSTLAQSPDEKARIAEIEARFTAATPPDLAWAARLAADYRESQFVPRLIPLIRHDDYQVRGAALDALVILKADVPNDIVEGVIRGNNDAGLIIAGLHPEAHRSLLHLLDGTPSGNVWLTLNSIYFASAPPGYTERLLRQWTMSVNLIVSKPGISTSRPGEVIGAGGVCGDGSTQPSLYPSPRRHVIQAAAPGRGTVLALGPHPLVYGYDSCIIGMGAPTRDAYTLDFLHALGDFHEPLPAPTINYVNAAQYRQAAAAERTKIHAYIERLRKSLIAHGKLPPGDRTMPRVNVIVDDQRPNKRTPLPEIRW